MKNLIRVGLISLTLTFASTTHAQLGGLLGGGGSSSGGPSPESVIKNYVEGAKAVLQAQGKLLLAMGKKQEAAATDLQAQNLTEGATKQNLEDSVKTQTENSKLIEENLKAKGAVLDAAAKVIYAQGLGYFGTGITKYIALTRDLKSFKPSVTALGSAAQSAVYVAQTLPGNMSNFSSTLKNAIDFGKAQGVEIPSSAAVQDSI